jgi:predicted phosphodiesterase
MKLKISSLKVKLRRFVFACLLLMLGLNIYLRIGTVKASISTSSLLERWAFFSDSHVDYGHEDYLRWINACDWIASDSETRLVINTGDFVTYPTNLTAWQQVKEGIDTIRDAGKMFLAVVGNHDAFYNSTLGGGDYRNFKTYTGMASENYTYIHDGELEIMFIALTYQYSAWEWSISKEQWDWFDSQVSNTDLPVVVLMHSPVSSQYVLHRSEGAYDSYLTRIKQHSNVFMVLFGHSHEPAYYIVKGDNGNPIYIYTSHKAQYETVHDSFVSVFDIYSNYIEISTFDPWTSTWHNSSRDGNKLTIPFAGIGAIGSGHLANDDFSDWGNSETDYFSPPKSYCPPYDKTLSKEIPAKRREYWIEIRVNFSDPFMSRDHIEIMALEGATSHYPVRSRWENGYFYPNATLHFNLTLSNAYWYSLIYFVNETSQTYDLYLSFASNRTLVYSWRDLEFLEKDFSYGSKFLYMRPYACYDDFSVTYSANITLSPDTVITLSNGTSLTQNFDVLTTGHLWLQNITVTKGNETRMMDVYGGDEISTFYYQELLLNKVWDTNENLKGQNNPYILNATRAVTSLVYINSKLSFTVDASNGEISLTKVYVGDKGEPTNVLGASSWTYDSTAKILTLAVIHGSPVTVTIEWGGATVEVEVDMKPDTLNLRSKGRWITAYIELPEGYKVRDIDLLTVKLNGEVPARLHPTKIGDYDADSIPDLMVKFDRREVSGLLDGGETTLTITGEVNETPFEGTDTIGVLDK